MAHTEDPVEWHLEGVQDFRVRMRSQLRGSTIATITTIVLQRQTGMNPDVWQTTGVVPESSQIVADDFDPDNPVASGAVIFIAAANNDGDPVPGASPYRWLVVVALANGLDIVAKVPVILIP